VIFVVIAVVLAIGVPLLPALFWSLVARRPVGLGDLDAPEGPRLDGDPRGHLALGRPAWLDWLHVPMCLLGILAFPVGWAFLFWLLYRGYLSTLAPAGWVFPSGDFITGCILASFYPGLVTGMVIDATLTRLLLGARRFRASLDFEQARTGSGPAHFARMWLILAGPFGLGGAIAIALTLPTHERLDDAGIGLKGVASLSEAYYPYERVRDLSYFPHRFSEGKFIDSPYLVVTFDDGRQWEPRVRVAELERLLEYLETKTGRKAQRVKMPRPGGP
jgi:hypothetical protein